MYTPYLIPVDQHLYVSYLKDTNPQQVPRVLSFLENCILMQKESTEKFPQTLSVTSIDTRNQNPISLICLTKTQDLSGPIASPQARQLLCEDVIFETGHKTKLNIPTSSDQFRLLLNNSVGVWEEACVTLEKEEELLSLGVYFVLMQRIYAINIINSKDFEKESNLKIISQLIVHQGVKHFSEFEDEGISIEGTLSLMNNPETVFTSCMLQAAYYPETFEKNLESVKKCKRSEKAALMDILRHHKHYATAIALLKATSNPAERLILSTHALFDSYNPKILQFVQQDPDLGAYEEQIHQHFFCNLPVRKSVPFLQKHVLKNFSTDYLFQLIVKLKDKPFFFCEAMKNSPLLPEKKLKKLIHMAMNEPNALELLSAIPGPKTDLLKAIKKICKQDQVPSASCLKKLSLPKKDLLDIGKIYFSKNALDTQESLDASWLPTNDIKALTKIAQIVLDRKPEEFWSFAKHIHVPLHLDHKTVLEKTIPKILARNQMENNRIRILQHWRHDERAPLDLMTWIKTLNAPIQWNKEEIHKLLKLSWEEEEFAPLEKLLNDCLPKERDEGSLLLKNWGFSLFMLCYISKQTPKEFLSQSNILEKADAITNFRSSRFRPRFATLFFTEQTKEKSKFSFFRNLWRTQTDDFPGVPAYLSSLILQKIQSKSNRAQKKEIEQASDELLEKIKHSHIFRNKVNIRLWLHLLDQMYKNPKIDHRNFFQVLNTLNWSARTKPEIKKLENSITQIRSICMLEKPETYSHLIHANEIDPLFKSTFSKHLNIQDPKTYQLFSKLNEKIRDPFAIPAYLSALKKTSYPECDSLFKTFIYTASHGTFRESRYDHKHSKHLSTIASKQPQVYSSWQKNHESPMSQWLPSPTKLSAECSNLLQNSLQNGVNQGHISHKEDLAEWREELQKTVKELSQVNKTHTKEEKQSLRKKRDLMRFYLLALNILEPKENILLHRFKAQAEQLIKHPLAKPELQEEITKLITEIKSVQSNHQLILKETDDPLDIFLCTSEPEHSCLSPYAFNKNEPLLAYLLDGKHKIITLCSKDGRILSRALLRLLWDEKNETSVLHLEHIYGRRNKEIRQVIHNFVAKRGQEMGIPALVSTQIIGKPYPAISSLDSVAPVEWVDSKMSLENKSFEISHSYRLN